MLVESLGRMPGNRAAGSIAPSSTTHRYAWMLVKSLGRMPGNRAAGSIAPSSTTHRYAWMLVESLGRMLGADDAKQRLQDTINVEDTCADSGTATNTDKPCTGVAICNYTDIDRMMEAEREAQAEEDRMEAMKRAQALAEYETSLEDEAREDEDRYETMRAAKMREWEDWVMEQNIGGSSGPKGARLSIQVFLQGQAVEPAVMVDLVPGSSVGITMSAQTSSPAACGFGGGNVDRSASAASTMPVDNMRLIPEMPSTQLLLDSFW